MFRLFFFISIAMLTGASGAKSDGVWVEYPEFRETKVLASKEYYLWCVTSEGLIQVDTRDMSYVVLPDWEISFRLPSPDIAHCIAIDEDDNVWVGTTEYGLLKYDGTAWTQYSTEGGFPGNGYITVAVDDDNTVWAGWNGTDGGCVTSFDGESWKTYGPEDGLPDDLGETGIKYAYGKVWVFYRTRSLDVGIAAYYDSTKWNEKYAGIHPYQVNFVYNKQFAIGPDDEFWYWTQWKFESLGVTELHDQKTTIYSAIDGYISGIAYSSDEVVWIGGNKSLTKMRLLFVEGDTCIDVSPPDVSPPEYLAMYSFAIDRNDVIWVGTNQGIYAYTRDDITSVSDSTPILFAIIGNYPNPFNPATTIEFSLVADAFTTLDIYDITGRHVKTLSEDHLPAGTHSVVWKGADDSGAQVASGIYFCRLQAEERIAVQRMVLMK